MLSAYADNAAVIEGWNGERSDAAATTREYGYVDEPIHILMKVETHNHPTAISPFPGRGDGFRRRDPRRRVRPGSARSPRPA